MYAYDFLSNPPSVLLAFPEKLCLQLGFIQAILTGPRMAMVGATGDGEVAMKRRTEMVNFLSFLSCLEGVGFFRHFFQFFHISFLYCDFFYS